MRSYSLSEVPAARAKQVKDEEWPLGQGCALVTAEGARASVGRPARRPPRGHGQADAAMIVHSHDRSAFFDDGALAIRPSRRPRTPADYASIEAYLVARDGETVLDVEGVGCPPGTISPRAESMCHRPNSRLGWWILTRASAF